jgi:hypothetical protein
MKALRIALLLELAPPLGGFYDPAPSIEDWPRLQQPEVAAGSARSAACDRLPPSSPIYWKRTS